MNHRLHPKQEVTALHRAVLVAHLKTLNNGQRHDCDGKLNLCPDVRSELVSKHVRPTIENDSESIQAHEEKVYSVLEKAEQDVINIITSSLLPLAEL